jgi:hypothetical protein
MSHLFSKVGYRENVESRSYQGSFTRTQIAMRETFVWSFIFA